MVEYEKNLRKFSNQSIAPWRHIVWHAMAVGVFEIFLKTSLSIVAKLISYFDSYENLKRRNKPAEATKSPFTDFNIFWCTTDTSGDMAFAYRQKDTFLNQWLPHFVSGTE